MHSLCAQIHFDQKMLIIWAIVFVRTHTHTHTPLMAYIHGVPLSLLSSIIDFVEDLSGAVFVFFLKIEFINVCVCICAHVSYSPEFYYSDSFYSLRVIEISNFVCKEEGGGQPAPQPDTFIATNWPIGLGSIIGGEREPISVILPILT